MLRIASSSCLTSKPNTYFYSLLPPPSSLLCMYATSFAGQIYVTSSVETVRLEEESTTLLIAACLPYTFPEPHAPANFLGVSKAFVSVVIGLAVSCNSWHTL